MLVTSPLFAQQHTLEVNQYLHTSWTAREGFFKGGIHSVAQTSDGYLWVLSATGGLLRFDGVRFSEWKPPSNEALPSKPLFRLLASRDGSLWIGGIGLAELKANGETHRYHRLDGTWIVGALIEDKDGGIWAGGPGHPESPRLCRFYHGESDCIAANGFLGSKLGALHEDGNGQLFAGTSTGIWRLRPGPPKQIASIPEGQDVEAAFDEDASGTLVFNAGNDMKMVTAAGTVARYPIDIPQSNALLKDREGDLWFGTTKGIFHVHEGRTDRFTTLDGLSSDYVRCIFQDREQNVWVGTKSGLDKFTKPAVASLTSQQGLSHDLVTSVLTASNGIPWIGTVDGLYKLDNGLVKSTVRLPGKYNHIGSLFETSDGRMLVAAGDNRGLVWLDGDKISRLRAESGEDVLGVAEDKRGELWVASIQFGLLHLNGHGKLIEFYNSKTLGRFGIALAYDPGRDGLWLTSRIGDLGFFKDGKFIEKYGTADGLGEGNVRDPQVDNDGGVWVGTQVGLAHLMNGKISVLGLKNGLPCDQVHWMRRDKDHNIWLYMECGLVAFSEHELSTWIASPTHTIAIAHYLDNTDGVNNAPNTGWYTPQTAMTGDGRILFLGQGLSILDPRNLNQNPLPPPVHVEEVTADEREIKGAGRVSLPVGARKIQIGFTALSFANPRKVLFRYKLQRYDKDWSSPVSPRQATYTNLPPGDYEFRVIACNNDGVWNTTGDSLSFFIPPAFYQAVWFKLLMAIIIGGLLWTLYLLRLKQATANVQKRLLAQIEERERIARELHDTLLQGFQGITLRMQGVSKNMPSQDPLRKMMEEVLDRGDEVMREARQRVRNLRRRTTDDNDLSDRLTKHGEELSQDHPAGFSLAIVGAPRILQSTVQDEAYRIAAEAMANAFRHASALRIEVEVTYDSSTLRIRVRDDGIGIGNTVLVNGQPGHWGLAGMRERAQAIRAELNIWSREAAGTEVELVIPAAIAYPREQTKTG